MTIPLGFFNTSGTRTHVRFQFPTFSTTGGNVAPLSAFEASDIRIYRAADGAAFSNVQRASSNGITMTSPFDTLIGFHDVDIDLTDNSDAGFYASGYTYSVVLSPDETVDGQTITGVVLAMFEIGSPTVALTDAAIDAILDDAVDGAATLRQLVRGMAAALLGKASGMAANAPVFRDVNDTKNRVSATTDTDGNRTAVTLDLT